jgi:DNA-directed RNA polymerase specialized sigma24 family protein
MHTPLTTTSVRGEADQIAELEREWPALAPRIAPQLKDWQRFEPALAPFSSPQQLLRFLHDQEADPRVKDAILTALLRRARTDLDARRLLLQALLPGLKRIAATIILDQRDRGELRQLLLAAAWEQICRYPLARRPSHVAANLLLDTRHAALQGFAGEQHRRRDLPERPLERVPKPHRHADLEAPLKRALAAKALTPEEAELILCTRIDRTPLAELAVAQGVPYDALRVRRRRAERRLLLFLGEVAVRSGGRKTHSSYARVVGDGLTGSAGRGAVTHLKRRR